MSPAVECIANPGDNGAPEVPLWDCPCRECWALEMSAIRLTTENPDRPEVVTWAEWLADHGAAG